MFDAANAELEEIDSLCRHLPEVLMARAAIYHGLKNGSALETRSALFADIGQTSVSRCTSTRTSAKAILESKGFAESSRTRSCATSHSSWKRRSMSQATTDAISKY